MTGLDVERVRRDFPALAREIRGRPAIFLDNACTTLRPRAVIEAVTRYQETGAACHGRSYHRFGREATDALEQAREAVRRFLGAASAEEVVFVRNTTEALNLVARCLPLPRGARVVTTGLEHNSNLLPWQALARDGSIRHEVLRMDPAAGLDLDALRAALKDGAGLVSLFHVSNLCGIENPIPEVCREAHARGALVLVDGAQAVATRPVNVREIGADLYAFSLHKMFGPTGIGVLWARREVLGRMRPFLLGGDTVRDATYAGCVLEDPPSRFEAGVANVEGAVGARAAVEYLESVGLEAIHQHVETLNRMATEAISALPRIRLIGPADAARRGAVLNFHVEGLEARGLARVLDETDNVMVRAGRHCVHAWYHAEGVPDSIRVSFALYNTESEVRTLARALRRVLDMVA